MNIMVATVGKSLPPRHYKAYVKEIVDALFYSLMMTMFYLFNSAIYTLSNCHPLLIPIQHKILCTPIVIFFQHFYRCILQHHLLRQLGLRENRIRGERVPENETFRILLECLLIERCKMRPSRWRHIHDICCSIVITEQCQIRIFSPQRFRHSDNNLVIVWPSPWMSRQCAIKHYNT